MFLRLEVTAKESVVGTVCNLNCDVYWISAMGTPPPTFFYRMESQAKKASQRPVLGVLTMRSTKPFGVLFARLMSVFFIQTASTIVGHSILESLRFYQWALQSEKVFLGMTQIGIIRLIFFATVISARHKSFSHGPFRGGRLHPFLQRKLQARALGRMERHAAQNQTSAGGFFVFSPGGRRPRRTLS